MNTISIHIYSIMREDLPEKQGLKPIACDFLRHLIKNERGSSRKTRIETLSSYSILIPISNERGSSRKTRIETGRDGQFQRHSFGMREDLPEKQGLKLARLDAVRQMKRDERGSSRKTRIETLFHLRYIRAETE